MFANTFQSGFLTIFYSVGSSPLQLWDKQVKNGHIRRVVDDEVKSLVLEISGTNVATTYITCPIKPRLSLGIRLPFLVMIIKNMKKYFTFEIQILDDKDMHRRFRVSNFQSTTKVRPFCTTMPIGLSSGWNQVQFNLADFTKRAYGSTYIETTRVQIHANVRIRRIYFSDVLYSDEELPNEYKLFVPTPSAPRQPPQQKKPPAAKQPEAEEKTEPKRLSAEEINIQITEKEIPSGAPPSPAGMESPKVEEPEPEREPTETDEARPSEVAEPPSEGAEVPAISGEVTTEEVTEATSTEPPTESQPVGEGGEGETFVDASDQPPAPEEEGAAAEVPPAEEPPTEAQLTEAPPAEESLAEAPVEEVNQEEVQAMEEEAPPAEEAPIEAPPAEEAPPEEAPAEEAPTEAPPE